MKEKPRDQEIKKDMQPGRLILDGFLGDDDRPLEVIINEDKQVLDDLDVTCQELAAAMDNLSHTGTEALGQPAELDGYIVVTEEWMGWLGCPFKDGRRLAKRNSTVTHVASGEEMTWSDLHIHLIGEHGFFQGKGSSHRLEPAALVRFLRLQQD